MTPGIVIVVAQVGGPYRDTTIVLDRGAREPRAVRCSALRQSRSQFVPYSQVCGYSDAVSTVIHIESAAGRIGQESEMYPLAVVPCVRLSVFTGVFVVSSIYGDVATAQTRRPRAGAPGSVEALDNRAEDIERDYLTGLLQLAGEYEEAGQIDKARDALQAILRLKPDTEAVKEKLREFDEAVFDANSTMVEVDAARSWVSTGVQVTRDEPIRLTAEGSYRFIVNDTVGPAGFSTEDNLQDMAAGVPAGALMGMIAPARRPGQRQPPEPGPPFIVGTELDLKPNTTGVLLLRVNTPPGGRCVGKLRVEISGNISPAP